MAEETAKTRLGMKLLKLSNCHKALKLTITVDREALSPATERLLERQVKHLKDTWEAYEEGMCKLQECAAAENLVTYTAAFEAQHVEFVATNEQVQEFLVRFNPPPEVVVPDPVALTVANAQHREDITQDLVDILDDAEDSLERAPSPPLHAHVENLLRAVEEKLNQVFISTRESAVLDPDGHAAVLTAY